MALRAVEHLLLIRPRTPPLAPPRRASFLTPAGRSAFSASSGAQHLLRASKKKKKNSKSEAGDESSSSHDSHRSSRALLRVKRRTRSDLRFLLDDADTLQEQRDHQHLHVPVMLGEVLQVFHLRRVRSFVDCTLGAAGHSSAMMRSHPEITTLVGLDVDPAALDASRSRLEQWESGSARVHTRLSNFRHVKSVLGAVDREIGGVLAAGVDGILMDLGMSSMQVDDPERGFSILKDGPLDMRMDPRASLTAEDILNSWPEDEIGRILREYGEESSWKLLQRKIIDARVGGGLHSTSDLAKLIRMVPLRSRGRHGWLKTATRVFQALRIAVNDELKTLEDALYACFDCLSPGGRLAVISFHSLEDRIIKHTFLDIVGKSTGDDDELAKLKEDDAVLPEEWIKGRIVGKKAVILTKRPITPSEGEENSNPRCRSAKLRVLEKLSVGWD